MRATGLHVIATLVEGRDDGSRHGTDACRLASLPDAEDDDEVDDL